MAYSPHSKVNGKKESANTKKSIGGFLSLIKKISRLLNRTKKTAITMRVKRDISRLEHERTKEHNELLRQRRFYEGLLRRSNAPRLKNLAKDDYKVALEVTENLPPMKNVSQSELNQPLIKESSALSETILEPDKPVLEPDLVEAKDIDNYQIPNSQDIYPANQITSAVESAETKDIAIKPIAPIVEPDQLGNDKNVIKDESINNLTLEPSQLIEDKTIIKNKNTEPTNGPVIKNKFFKKLINLFSGSSLVKKLAEERKLEEAVKSKNEVESRFWQAYNGVKANLIKDQGVLFFNWQQKMLTLSLSLILSCLAISLVYVGLLIWQKEKLNDNQATIANFEAINIEVLKNEDELKEITAFNKKLDIVSFILNNHVYWTSFLAFLENNTLKDVYYESFTGDLTGNYRLPAVARNLDAVSLQLEVMKAYPMIRSVQYSSSQTVTATKDSPAIVKFNLEMSLDPKIFIK